MNSIIEHGVSETLLSDFQALRETEGVFGLKYHGKTIDKLARYLCCRNYAYLTLELSYLSWAVVNFNQSQNSLLEFFWIDESISPTAFRRSFLGCEKVTWLPRGSQLGTSDLGLAISIDGTEFTISATRVVLLSAFLELLVSHFPKLLDKIREALIGNKLKEIKSNATDLQKEIYDWLKVHLPTAQLQNRFRNIDEWIGRLPPSRNDQNVMVDENILQFWQQMEGVEGYVKFTGVVDDMLDYVSAKDSVTMAHAARTSMQLENVADILCNDELALYETCQLGETDGLSELLTHTPKFLSSKQFQTVFPFIRIYDTIPSLRLTGFRYHIFGEWQAKIIQASRRVTLSEQTLVLPTFDYDSLIEVINKIIAQNQVTELAVADILCEKKCAEFLPVLIQSIKQSDNDADHGAITDMTEKLIAQGVTMSEGAFAKTLAAWKLQFPTLNKLLILSEKARKKVNRIGFKDVDKLDSVVYSNGVEKLREINSKLKRYVKNAEDCGLNLSMSEKFASDLSIFKKELIKRHVKLKDE